MGYILRISRKLNLSPNTLGCHGLKYDCLRTQFTRRAIQKTFKPYFYVRCTLKTPPCFRYVRKTGEERNWVISNKKYTPMEVYIKNTISLQVYKTNLLVIH